MKNTGVKIILISLLAFSFFHCKEDVKTDSKTIDGVYESLGYGRLVKVEDGEFLIADITDISCQPIMSGEVSELGDKLRSAGDTLFFKDGINDYQFIRIADAPQVCKDDTTDKAKDPVHNFEVLAETFKDHYAYFEERNVDWDKMYAEYRAKVSPKTTEVELYLIMDEMLDSFGDGHIGLSASEEVEEAAAIQMRKDIEKEASEPAAKRYNRKELADAVADKYIPNGKSKHYEFIRWGTVKDSIGYVQVNQMMGYADYGIPDTLGRREYYMAYFEKSENSLDNGKDELVGLQPTIKEMMTDLMDTKAMIIDLRFNGGGNDEVGMTILSNFNPTEHTVFSKKAKHGTGFTADNVVVLKASESPYLKPTYLLIGDGSASATEIMTLSSLQLDHVTRIGSSTNGVFSDILEKTLPNEWEFGLSNEVYLDTDGNNYEGLGIAPDIDLGYPKDRQAQFTLIMKSLEDGDAAIEKAIALIK